MNDETPTPPRRPGGIGGALAVGAGIGTVLFAATGNPVWIGLGAGIGVAVGAAVQGHT